MNKHIDAETLKADVKKIKVIIDEDVLECETIHDMLVYLLARIEKSVIDIIDSQPAADVAPVVRAEWADDEYLWECTRCDTWLVVEQGDADMNFCPNCGAKMVNA